LYDVTFKREEGTMKRSSASKMMFAMFAGVALMASAADSQLTVPVAFGRGLDTAQPGNAVNHAVLPDKIRVAEGGVVHFLVSGLHQIFVYHQGTEVGDIAVPVSDPFINDERNLKYKGINPAGGPLGTAATANPSNAVNRLESITFDQPGTYLVICNVRQHFQDGMHAVVNVVPRSP
jgi:plastocyanin